MRGKPTTRVCDPVWFEDSQEILRKGQPGYCCVDSHIRAKMMFSAAWLLLVAARYDDTQARRGSDSGLRRLLHRVGKRGGGGGKVVPSDVGAGAWKWHSLHRQSGLCFVKHKDFNLFFRATSEFHQTDPRFLASRCRLRFMHLEEALHGCARTPWCGGVTRDNGLRCGRNENHRFELRHPKHHTPLDGAFRQRPEWEKGMASWIWHRNATEAQCDAYQRSLASSREALSRPPHAVLSPVAVLHASLASIGAGPAAADPLSLLLQAAERVASHRMERGPPAYERYPQQALRYRTWSTEKTGRQTRHGRGDAYPLYTVDTLRNLSPARPAADLPPTCRRIEACMHN